MALLLIGVSEYYSTVLLTFPNSEIVFTDCDLKALSRALPQASHWSPVLEIQSCLVAYGLCLFVD